MGIDISNSLIVGASYEELEEFIQGKIDSGEFNDKYEVVEVYFSSASPYYDAPIKQWFLGIEVTNYVQITDEWITEIKSASKEFEKMTGVKPHLRGGSHVY